MKIRSGCKNMCGKCTFENIICKKCSEAEDIYIYILKNNVYVRAYKVHMHEGNYVYNYH